ncbi:MULTISPECIES: hypothetical protein [Streptomyces]|uniref:Uncharacterized protein n=1 Tax=Streptomyces dengpaensis TaxID=2049881 RepID=A0ABM6SJD8_9ACTN|nr:MULTISPECIES: hypothetical protein [Streptomyces]AVH54623.1 hypothetical protein C4B68_00900 [Streptomyces dengpaensis]PIA98557.1 hypothetical protein B1C81_39525 [Streptomyces sp. HG99]
MPDSSVKMVEVFVEQHLRECRANSDYVTNCRKGPAENTADIERDVRIMVPGGKFGTYIGEKLLPVMKDRTRSARTQFSEVSSKFAVLAALVLVALLGIVVCIAWLIARRTPSADLPQVLLGLSHVISALCGLLPWGKPSAPPALQPPPAVEQEPAAVPTVVVVRSETALRSAGSGREG